MDKTNLIADLKASLQDAAKPLTDPGDFERMLDVAAAAMASKRPHTKMSSFTLTADEAEYSGVPSDLVAVKVSPWGHSHAGRRTPWNYRNVDPLPILTIFNGDSGRMFRLDPAPTAEQIALYGATYRYYYFAVHTISDTASETTIAAADRSLLLLRAQAEAMRELAMRNYTKPVSMRGGEISTPKNGTAAALYQALLTEFQEAP